jgi:3',5'-cyclic-AMP phosphodiesterase
VSDPFLLVQLSDPHMGADWGGGDPEAKLAAAIEAVRSLDARPDAVLVSGDLADHAADGEYERARELLGELDVPVHVLPGNHDDRDALRRHFGLPGANGEPVQYSVSLGPVRLVLLDSTRPGDDGGELGAERIGWLDSELTGAPDLPTVVAMHHPPLLTGIPAMDVIGLPDADRRALGRVVGRHRQVRCLVAGHVHRAIVGHLGGRPVLVAPSTYVQLRLDFRSDQIQVASEPAGFALHALVDGELVSHVQPVT